MEAPHVAVDLQPATQVRAAVLLTQAAVSRREATLPHPCKQQQLIVVQVMDETYNPSLSKMMMKRPPRPLQSKRGAW